MAACARRDRILRVPGWTSPPRKTRRPAETVQLRITWGGGEPSRWTGSVALDDGSLSNLKLLGTDADAAGSVWLDGGKLQIATLSAHKVDSIEVAAQSTATAKLQLELAATDKATAQRLEVPLAEIVRQPYQVALDDRGNTLDIRIVPPPALRISVQPRSAHFFAR